MAVAVRREMFRSVGTVAVSGGAIGGTEVATAARAAAVTADPLVATDPDLHLLRRLTYGPTPDSLAELRRLGHRTWLNRQLNPSSIDDRACAHLIKTRYPHTLWTVSQARQGLDAFSWDLMFELGQATIARAVWSKRQLFEVMVDFWSNHLNVTNPSDNVWDNRQDYDRVVIRKHALGRFEDMLIASAQHPAMLMYLNNNESTKYELNENYGRELLELHTVGVDGGYDETDMLNSARIMTGFGVVYETGGYLYTASDHDVHPVRVMDFHRANSTGKGGYAVGIAYLKYLATHPSTAKHLATKLCQRFISDAPPPDLVKHLAKVYLANQTAVVPVLRELFASAAFRHSTGKKVRRPFEDLVATLRVLGYRPDKSGTDGLQGLFWMAQDLGQAPMGWPQPNGFPDEAIAWQSAGGVLSRWNSHMSLVGHWWPSSLRQPPLQSLLPKKLPATHGALVDALAKRLVFRTLTPAHRKAVLAFMGHQGSDPLTSASSAVSDWGLTLVVSLILDTPYHAQR
jgi:uncharacterized protein (DUF1800 family)